MVQKPVQFFTLQHHLRGVEVLHQIVDIGNVALCHIELAGRNIEERNAVNLVPEMQAAKEIVLFHVQHHVVVRHSGCHQLGDAAFHQSLHRLGVFKLLADGHTQPCPHQPWQILVHRMVWNACQVGIAATTARFTGKG